MNYCVGSPCPFETEHVEANYGSFALMVKDRMTPEQEEELFQYYCQHDNPGE